MQSGEASRSHYRPGDILLNKYRIEGLLGRGGFAEVYRATHLKLNAPRAVKVLRKDAPGVGSQDFRMARERFKFEAQLGARLDHPNVVKVYDFEEAEDALFLVMEYAPGGSLRDRLEQEGALSVEDVIRLGLEVCGGLRVLHENLKAVHRDIKPANILFDEHGRAKVADLGLAQVPDDRIRRSLLGSLAGAHPGSPLYMSPEQETGRGILLPTSDLFSLGCVLFEALTGVAYKNVYGSRVRDHRPDVPAWLDAVIARALAETPGRVPEDGRDTTKRYRRAEDLLRALERRGEDGKRKRLWGALAAGFVAALVLILRVVFGGDNLVIPDSPETTQNAPLAAMLPTTAAPPKAAEQDGVSSPAATPVPADTEMPAPTFMPSPTYTATPQPTITPSPTANPTLAPGATMVSPVDGMVMVYVPAGEFEMGSDPGNDPYFWGAEAPSHLVSVGGFWIYKTEVTNEMYQKCVDDGGCSSPKQVDSDTRSIYYGDPRYSNYPVIHVTWYQARDYCLWAGGRLPTEAEWEKAARGEDGRLFPWGNQAPSSKLANLCDRGCSNPDARLSNLDDGYADTSPVGNYPAGVSPYGAYDVAGNVWEWVADWYQTGYYASSPYENPQGPPSGERKGIRGGSWFNGMDGVRTVVRSSRKPDDHFYSIGFRCVMDSKH